MCRGWEIVSNPTLGPAFVIQNKKMQKCLTFPSDLSNTTEIFKMCNPNDPYQQMRFSYDEPFYYNTVANMQIRSYIPNGDSYYVSCLNSGWSVFGTNPDGSFPRPYFDTCQDTIDFGFFYDVSLSRIYWSSTGNCLTAPFDPSVSKLEIRSCNPTYEYQFWGFVRPGMLDIRPCNPTYQYQFWGFVRLGLLQEPSWLPPHSFGALCA